MAGIAIRDVRKSYGSLEVMHGVSLDIKDGEFVTLVGPSGCGKSTLLRMIAGLEAISGGTVEIGARVVNGLAPKDRNVAMVFQNYALYPHMTVAENMGYSLRLKRTPKAEYDGKIQRVAEILGLGELLQRYPGQLSGGQRQRVAMGRAIVREPDVFLFDEPLSNLDAKLRVQMRLEIKELHARLGTTVIYVTHDQIEAMTMADRIVVMRDGVVEQVGSPLELYDNPANAFVAGFLGSPSMNFLEGRLTGGADQGFELTAGTILRTGRQMPGDSSPALLGIRPESIRIEEGGTEVRIAAIEPTGADTHITASIAGQHLTIVINGRVSAKVGETIPVAVDPAALRYFAPEDGRRLA